MTSLMISRLLRSFASNEGEGRIFVDFFFFFFAYFPFTQVIAS